MNLPPLQKHLNERAARVLEGARVYCEGLLQKLTQLTDRFVAEKQFDPELVCFAVVGSVGRFEALQASDVDFTPVLKDQAALDKFKEHDQPLRELIRQQLKVDVSQGAELTCPAALDDLANPAKIGCTEKGNEDNSASLTRRILILTEGKQAGGKLLIRSIRQRILQAYSGEDRSRGRHVLSLCNDLARYYRTLCIEYKSKVDGKEEKWGLRNMKLRHSRKFWFFSCILAIAHLAESNPQGDAAYIDGLLEAFDHPPYQRLLGSVEVQYPHAETGNAGQRRKVAEWRQTSKSLSGDLEAAREIVLAHSDDIWDSIDHNDTQALDEGVHFKRAYNEKKDAAYGLLATELSVIIQQYTTVRLEEAEQIGADDHERNQRIIAELNREETHSLDEEFTFKRPHGFILDDKGTNGITTWRRLYELVCQQLLRKDPGRFHDLPGNSDFISSRGKRSFSQDAGELRSAGLLGDGIHAESNQRESSGPRKPGNVPDGCWGVSVCLNPCDRTANRANLTVQSEAAISRLSVNPPVSARPI